MRLNRKEFTRTMHPYVKKIIYSNSRRMGWIDLEWENIIYILADNRHLLTLEEEELIKKISDRL